MPYVIVVVVSRKAGRPWAGGQRKVVLYIRVANQIPVWLPTLGKRLGCPAKDGEEKKDKIFHVERLWLEGGRGPGVQKKVWKEQILE